MKQPYCTQNACDGCKYYEAYSFDEWNIYVPNGFCLKYFNLFIGDVRQERLCKKQLKLIYKQLLALLRTNKNYKENVLDI